MSNEPTREPGLVANRVSSIDAYRGFVMVLMMAEVLELSKVARAFKDSKFWGFLALHQTHVEWRGCSLHDMIQPSFSFLVGGALTFSLASRKRRGEPLAWSMLHAAWRSILLVCLGIFLRSRNFEQTNFTLEDTLTQIGLGYFLLFLIGLCRPRTQWIAFAVILIGYWAAFALYPLPKEGFDYKLAGVSPNWICNSQGFAAHWNKNTNAAWAFDRWFMNLFPRKTPFTHNGGGYSTLSFIPTLATMILGVIAGGWLRLDTFHWKKLARLVIVGLFILGLGYAADRYGICPSVKRIWTPSWVLFSGGICLLILAGFFLVNDMIGFKAWSYPLQVVGANAIFAYMMAHFVDDFVRASFRIHLGRRVFEMFGEAYEPLVAGAAVLAVEWLVLFWMYRRRIFIRI